MFTRNGNEKTQHYSQEVNSSSSKEVFDTQRTKLLNLIRKARPHEATEATTKVLKEISKSCNTCQRLGSQPTRLKTTLPTLKDVTFGEENINGSDVH